MNKLLCHELTKLKEKDQKKDLKHLLTKWKDGCVFPIHHKSLSISTKVLKKNKIEYEIVVQKPGDLIYLKPNIYHQVINININLCEAVNVGSPLWNLSAINFSSCFCSDSAIEPIQPNLKEHDNVTKLQPNVIAKSGKKLLLQQAKKKTYSCDQCIRVFDFPYKLNKHKQKLHETNIRKLGSLKCRYCNELIEKSRHADHEKQCEIPDDRLHLFSCKYCKILKKNNLKRHEKTCQSKTD